nr:unnamed protein product [Haemonchus contortus]
MMHRNLDGEESAERLYVTSKWTGQERVPHGELQVYVKVHCESSSTTEQMILHNHEDSITIEISMDLLYDIKNLNDTIHQVFAHITPLKCHKVCWQSFLLARLSSTDYRGNASQECRDIESTTSVTYLRHMKQYAIEKHASGFELVVDTELNEDTEEGFVTLSALNLAKDDSKPRMKTFGRGDDYTSREVKLHLGPFCESKESSTEVLKVRKQTENEHVCESKGNRLKLIGQKLLDEIETNMRTRPSERISAGASGAYSGTLPYTLE